MTRRDIGNTEGPDPGLIALDRAVRAYREHKQELGEAVRHHGKRQLVSNFTLIGLRSLMVNFNVAEKTGGHGWALPFTLTLSVKLQVPSDYLPLQAIAR